MNSIKKALLGIIALATVASLTACGGQIISSVGDNSSAVSNVSDSAESSAAASSSGVDSFGSSETASSEISSMAYIDYVNDGSVKLGLDYKGHDFYKDGVGQVSLKSPIDGDTAHFTPKVTTTSSETIKSRFFGIDTPESTGKVQEYGKAASNFTKEKLEKADADGTIVVSAPISTYQTPSFDSTGTRYVSLVWINLTVKDCPFDQLVLLNLWIVQDGFSWVKNVSDMPAYESTFYAAQQQATDLKLNLFSGLPDPLFNYGDYFDTSLLDIKKEILKQFADPTATNKYSNFKVRIQGTVAGFANNVLYLQSYFTKENGAATEEGEYAGINIFTGMSAIPSKYTKKNTYIQVCGLAVDSEQFGFQITSASFPIVSSDENDAKVLIKAEDNIEDFKLHVFDYAPDALLNNDYAALNCAVNLTGEITVGGGYVSDKTITLYPYFNNASLPYTVYITFMYAPDPNQGSYYYSKIDDFKLGADGNKRTFTLTGVYSYHKTTSGKISFQIIPSKSADLVQTSPIDGANATSSVSA
ncbi:MAG: thermonuclease family protein [Bacilli bacterium]|jgi:endonuclease YncB( thermonuclease family)|nr:thermonuclease family protein [Bacilli bacterium]